MYIMPTDGGALYEYDDVSSGEDGIFSACADGKWGVVDYGGNELIPCQYASSVRFSEGLAAVTRDLAEGVEYIDGTGKTVIGLSSPISYDMLRQKMDLYGLGDVTALLPFSDGMAPFIDGDKYGYIDKSGAVAIPAQYEISGYIPLFYNGTADIYQDGRYFAIDKTGAETTPPDRTEPEPDAFHSRLADDRYYSYQDSALVDGAGNVLFAFEPDYIFNYYVGGLSGNGLLRISKRGEWPVKRGLIDLDGNFIIEPAFEELLSLNGKYAVRQGSYGGLVDENGDWIVKISLLGSLDD
jgi:hypothetical protein